HIDAEELLRAVEVPRSDVVTPLMFESMLIERARADRRRIVLPEADDDRILRAAATLLSREVADIVLLGDEAAVHRRAAQLGIRLDGAEVVDPARSPLLEPFAEEYARLRAHKGVTPERALDIVQDVSFFGTMMVHTGEADGMVSGAAHTTANTILPAFQIIRTRPGVSIVSSVFFMCLANRVLVYGDCAIVPDPTAEQLADIAISSAETAARFGIEPRVAMLSYSTGESGRGADVDKVRRATRLVRERRPDLPVDGPLQYDAAVDASVARAKLPGSSVAGRATVFVFPDLNTGNNTYKAVQRSAGAVAGRPVLQGLAKPVNDLSRGATVEHILNRVPITAVQAGEQRGSRGSHGSSVMSVHTILVVSGGCSSIKHPLIDRETEARLASGLVERIGEAEGRLVHRSDDGCSEERSVRVPDHTSAFSAMVDAFERAGTPVMVLGIRAVGHRVVQGGSLFVAPTRIDDAVAEQILELGSLAPLHNPGQYQAIVAAREMFP